VTASGDRLALLASAGRLSLRHNWLKTGFVSSPSGLTGSITNEGSNLTGASPGFLDLATQTEATAGSRGPVGRKPQSNL